MSSALDASRSSPRIVVAHPPARATRVYSSAIARVWSLAWRARQSATTTETETVFSSNAPNRPSNASSSCACGSPRSAGPRGAELFRMLLRGGAGSGAVAGESSRAAAFEASRRFSASSSLRAETASSETAGAAWRALRRTAAAIAPAKDARRASAPSAPRGERARARPSPRARSFNEAACEAPSSGRSREERAARVPKWPLARSQEDAPPF